MTIDVLLPFYGDVAYLKAAVRSVLAQTEDRWRLTVVDDGYPDPGVAAWFEDLQHPRVRYRRNKENLGANGNYRHVLTLAESEWVVVMGADDLMLDDYVAEIMTLVQAHPEASVIQPGIDVIDGEGRLVQPMADRVKAALRPSEAELRGERLAASLLRANWTYFPSLCWRRDVVASIGFRPGLDVVQDLALLLDVTAAGGSLALGRSTVFRYRRHGASDSSLRAVSGSRFREERQFFESMVEENRARGWVSAARAARWHLTSRLNAVSLVPTAVRARNWAATAALLSHAVTS
jgi:glycosyltransferase involved in cell wall biosynthesis